MSRATWTAEEWAALTWLEKHAHNFPAWVEFHNGGLIQWWNGRRWCDEASGAKDFEVVNIEYPQRVKPAREESEATNGRQ